MFQTTNQVYAGVGFYVSIFHITQLLGILHLQQIWEGDVK